MDMGRGKGKGKGKGKDKGGGKGGKGGGKQRRASATGRAERPEGCPEDVCYEWFRTGACSRGDSCWFQHPKARQMSKSVRKLTLIHISEPTRPYQISYAVLCLKKKK